MDTYNMSLNWSIARDLIMRGLQDFFKNVIAVCTPLRS